MSQEQITLFAILAATVAMFAWGRWRHDMVAMGALLTCVLTGLVPSEEAFAGFGHPAVITVAGVLVLSRSLQNSGAVDALTRKILPSDATPLTMIAGLTTIAAALSGFMNNVGALALLMPVAIKAAEKLDMPPGRLLMPLAFGSILGGMTTLIGTPPNLIVSGYRQQTTGQAFSMFDYAPVGFTVAAVGVLFIILIGWRIVPVRKRAGVEGFTSGAYVTEALVGEGSSSIDRTVRQIEEAVPDAHLQVLAVVRRQVRLRAPRPGLTVREGDILIVECEPAVMTNALNSLDLALSATTPAQQAEEEEEEKAENGEPETKETDTDEPSEPREVAVDDDHTSLVELVVPPNSILIGLSAQGVNLRARFHISLVAISRQGVRSVGRLRTTAIQAGDVLLLHGSDEAISEFATDFSLLPLAGRELRLKDNRQMLLSAGILLASVLAAATGLLAAPVAFIAGVLASMVTRAIPLRQVYEAIDWPVIVLLACLLPVAGAMLSTGAADVVANVLVTKIAWGKPVLALVLILIVTMTLSDIMNNAATVAVMAPIAWGSAQALGVNPDAFFMAVAIGGSCAFLTPIGHQNNTLILGPGGFRFGDYWKLGLPVEIIVTVVSVPMILLVWGL